MECDYFYGSIQNSHIRKNLTKNGEPQRYSWGTQKKKKKKKIPFSYAQPWRVREEEGKNLVSVAAMSSRQRLSTLPLLKLAGLACFLLHAGIFKKN